VIGGDTYYGKKYLNTEGYKSTASDPADTANTFSIWSKAPVKGADGEVVIPEPVVSNVNVALNTYATSTVPE